MMSNSQDYFWTPEWQKDEREADEDIEAGRVKRFSTAEELIADLDDYGNRFSNADVAIHYLQSTDGFCITEKKKVGE